MKPDPVASTRNPLVQRIRAARAGELHGVVIAEGLRLVEDAVAAGCRIVEVLHSEKLEHTERGQALFGRLARAATTMTRATDRVMERASGLTTHQGVLAFVERGPVPLEALVEVECPFLVVAAGVRDPGNLGALVRTAEAAGATGVVVLQGSAHPFRDKAVRGAAGSLFRLAIAANVQAARLKTLLQEKHLQLVAADQGNGEDLWDSSLALPLAILVGGEGAGVPAEVRGLCDRFVRIPMAVPLESLNVSVAAGVLLFEVQRPSR
jgi:TrmH family RNA methyltransferase